jgi:membrane protein implicated in regulation of membrane protease activity
MIRGLAAAALIGTLTVAIAAFSLVVVLPIVVARRWRRRYAISK